MSTLLKKYLLSKKIFNTKLNFIRKKKKFYFLVYFSLQILILIIFTMLSDYNFFIKKNTYQISYDLLLEKKYYEDLLKYQEYKLFNSQKNIDRLKKSIDHTTNQQHNIIIEDIISKTHVDPFEKENFPYMLYKNYQFNFASVEKINQDFLNQKTYDNINLIVEDLYSLHVKEIISDNSITSYYDLKQNELCSNIKEDLTDKEAVAFACIQEIIKFSKKTKVDFDDLISKAFNNLKKLNEEYTFPDQTELYQNIVKEETFKKKIREYLKNDFKNKVKIKEVNSFLSTEYTNFIYLIVVIIFIILINIIFVLNIINKKSST